MLFLTTSFPKSSKIKSGTIYLKCSQPQVPPSCWQQILQSDQVPVVVIGDQGSVFNDTVDGFVVDASDCTVLAGVGGGEQPATGIHAQLLALHWLVTQSLRKLHEKKLIQVADRALMQRIFTIVNSNVRSRSSDGWQWHQHGLPPTLVPPGAVMTST